MFFFVAIEANKYETPSVIRLSFFPFQNNPKNLDPSYKMDLDLRDCLGRVKLVLQKNFIGLIKLFVVILERKTPSYSQIYTVLL